MNGKEFVSVLFLAAAALALNAPLIRAQSVGETQSERSGGDSQTPLPPGSSSAGSGNASKTGNGPANTSQAQGGTSQGKNDTSVGGSQSERSGGDSQTPLPKGSRSAGADDSNRVRQGPRRHSGSQGIGGQADIRHAQEALKNQGHDPGPIDGIMGTQTRHALREFQSKNGLKQTGILDARTKQKLNIVGASSS